MSARWPGAGGGTHNLAGTPLRDDAEHAESDWLLARDLDHHAPAPSSEIACDHAELEDLLGDLPLGPADQSWHDEVLAAAASPASPASRWPRRAVAGWTAAVLTATAAAAAAWLLWPRPHAGELEVAILHVGRTRSDLEEVVTGDRLIARAQLHGAGDLRVFRAGGALVARCPEGPGCTASAGGELTVEIALDAPVLYQVILVVGTIETPPGGAMDAYLDAAHAAGAHIVMYPPIDVH